MRWKTVETLDVGYKHQVHTGRIVAVEKQKMPPRSESLIWARMERDCMENRLWVVKPSEIQTDLLLAKAKSIEQRIIPVRVMKLSGNERDICNNSEVDQCAPVEAVINNEQLPEPAKMSVQNQNEFGENVKQREIKRKSC